MATEKFNSGGQVDRVEHLNVLADCVPLIVSVTEAEHEGVGLREST